MIPIPISLQSGLKVVHTASFPISSKLVLRAFKGEKSPDLFLHSAHTNLQSASNVHADEENTRTVCWGIATGTSGLISCGFIGLLVSNL